MRVGEEAVIVAEGASCLKIDKVAKEGDTGRKKTNAVKLLRFEKEGGR
jgi:hypothetical protein